MMTDEQEAALLEIMGKMAQNMLTMQSEIQELKQRVSRLEQQPVNAISTQYFPAQDLIK